MLKDYLPEFMQDIEEIKAVNNSLDSEITNLNTSFEICTQDQYISDKTSDERLYKWEKALKLSSSGTHEERQNRILATIRGSEKLSKRIIEEIVYLICGCSCDVVLDKKCIKIYLDRVATIENGVINTVKVKDIKNAILQRMPAHLMCLFYFRNRKHRDLKFYTHSELGQYKNGELKGGIINE